MNKWYSTSTIKGKNYICGYCGKDITSNIGFRMYDPSNSSLWDPGTGYIYICHNCNKPTYISSCEQTPGASYGKNFEKEIFKNDLVYSLYNEACQCMKVNAYTSVGMCCRKLLMHISVDCGAEENKKFVYYVDYLDQNNYIPINCKKWVDIIRNKGNEANHEIIILNENDARQLIQFVQIMISVIYEMPYQATQYMGDTNEQ